MTEPDEIARRTAVLGLTDAYVIMMTGVLALDVVFFHHALRWLASDNLRGRHRTYSDSDEGKRAVFWTVGLLVFFSPHCTRELVFNVAFIGAG